MSDYDAPPSPDVDDVLQDDPHALPTDPVPVAVQGPVNIRQLPMRASSGRTLPVDAVETIAGDDDRRAQVTVWLAETGGPSAYVGQDRTLVQAGEALTVVAGIPVTLRGSQRIYAASATPGTAARLSVLIEQWAD
jgi:hypothetical protein